MPIAIVARLLGAPSIVVFVLAALAIVPLSGVMGAATESVTVSASADLLEQSTNTVGQAIDNRTMQGIRQ